MSTDPRYRHTSPRSFAVLFLGRAGSASVGLAALVVLILSGASWQTHRVDGFNARAVETSAQVKRIIGEEALVRYELPQGTYATRLSSRGLSAGEQVTIWAHPDRPTDISRSATRRAHFVGFWQVTAAIFGALALGLGWRAGRFAVRAVQTRMYGVMMDVAVTRVEIAPFQQHSAHPAGRLHWKDADGTFGVSLWQAHVHVAQWAPGDTTTIYRWRGQDWWLDDLGARPLAKTRIPNVRSTGQGHEDY